MKKTRSTKIAMLLALAVFAGVTAYAYYLNVGSNSAGTENIATNISQGAKTGPIALKCGAGKEGEKKCGEGKCGDGKDVEKKAGDDKAIEKKECTMKKDTVKKECVKKEEIKK